MTVEAWNRSADVVLRWLLERGLVSACVLAFALAAFVVLRARLRLTAPLFTASLAVLLVPVERLLPDALVITPVGRPVDFLAERLGPLPAVPEETGPAEAERTGANAPVLAANAPAEQIAEPAPLARPTVGAWLLLAWASVALSLLVVLVRNQLRVRRLVRAAVPSGRDAVEECARLARELGVTRPVRCLETDALDSPATWGVRRPVVLLPRGLSSRLAAAERRWILLHELHHVRRADVVQQFVQRLLQVVWWFDPFVWLANRIVDRQRECLCDDDALRRLGPGDRTGGARAFVKVLEGAECNRAAPGMALLWNERRFVKRRLLRLLEDPSAPATLSALVALVLVVATALPAARSLVGPLPPPAPAAAEDAATDEEPDLVPREVLARAVRWLLFQQQVDGHWRSSATGGPTFGGLNDVGVTGLATMALLDAPADLETEEVERAIAAAVRYFLVIQDEGTGQIGDEVGQAFSYNHGYATLALARTRAVRADLVPLERLQRAADAILTARNPHGGWRYGKIPSGDNDTSVTGLMLHALAAARDAGATVDAFAFASGLTFLDEMTDDATGRTGYRTRGRWSARFPEAEEAFPPDRTEAMTAVALSARLHVGVDEAADPLLARGFARLDARPPEWSAGGVDFYYWWYGTEAMRHLGGETWLRWKAGLVRALIDRQTREGEAAGSWPDEDPWSGQGGRVYSTALNLLSLLAAAR